MRYRTEFDQTQNYVKYFNNNKSVSMEKNTSFANSHSLLFLQDTLPSFWYSEKGEVCGPNFAPPMEFIHSILPTLLSFLSLV